MKMGKIPQHLSKLRIGAPLESTSSVPTAASPDPTPPGSAVQTKPSSTVAQPETDPVSDATGTPNIQQNAAFETPPAEIRREILSALDYQSLRALTRASPTFHQQYRLDRRFLLCGCLQRTLGAATFDACAAYRSDTDCFSEERTLESITEFLTSYQGRRPTATYSILDEALAEDEAVAMVVFHFTVIEPLVKRFTNWALDHLADETGGSPHRKPLSSTEEARVLRAMYRFQLCCNVFHDRRTQDGQPSFDPLDVVKLFFGLFEPWEVEQVLCIQDFSRDEFDGIFRDIEWDVNQENPRFADQGHPPTPTGAFNLDNSCK